MVGRFPQWNALRMRTPYRVGYQLMPDVDAPVIYAFNQSTVYAIEADGGEIIRVGRSWFPTNQAASPGSFFTPSVCQLDGTIATAILGGTSTPPAGLCDRGGDTSTLFSFNMATFENIIDVGNGPEYAVFCSQRTNSILGVGLSELFFCSKHDSTVNTVNTALGSTGNLAGIDCDRVGNWYVVYSGSWGGPGRTIERRTPNGGSVFWTKGSPVYTPSFPGKMIVVGPPELISGIWHQSLFVANSGSAITKIDCRNGSIILQTTTLVSAGWPYNLVPQSLNAVSDGIILVNRSLVCIEKISLTDFSLIWRYQPTHWTAVGAITPITVDCCGNTYFMDQIDTSLTGSKLTTLDSKGKLAATRNFLMPIAGQTLTLQHECGRIGGYNFPGEPWEVAGKPAIAFA